MDETSPLFRDVVQADRHNPLGAVIRAGYHDDECQSRQSHPSRQYQAESRTILQAVLSNYPSHHEPDAVNPVDPQLDDNGNLDQCCFSCVSLPTSIKSPHMMAGQYGKSMV